MRQTTPPTALLCMPAGEDRTAVRAALMAMNVVPQDILPSRSDLAQLAHALQTDPHCVAIIDLAGVQHAAVHIEALAELLPSPLARQRTVLTRPHRGLWAGDRAWAQALGFADLTAQLDSISLAAEFSPMLEWVAKLTGAQPMAGDTLARYFSAMQIKPDYASPRGLIRKATGLSAEAFCAAFSSNVKALDRTYRLKSYPSCFVGTDAVAWLTNRYAVPAEGAVALGAALQTLGMLHHVSHEHAFANEAFFYRTDASSAADRISPGALRNWLMAEGGVEVRDRLFHGKSYGRCFIGSEAVDWVSKFQKVARHDAETLLNRLFSFNLVEHVTREHPVRDGMFFYRFV
jgi:hypothetical protein